ncbi:glycosyltransferase family 4 protein (plasmid) [Paracoccus liaowanqingii]|uniref:Glycosyltransferase family 4 protein n=1 Tax=Paracoccus liaowanqingii TaxID=2560053 RepID=A0A4Y5ST10_9RHOB|nr:glycosyltransferase family 4 protein [Paracoccus liaowanqingii]QDA36642.1 glycosyltransferase family 4 protein [Paracoccus liaowanqingii]
MPHRPRVLIIAEAANPEWVSVPLVGWSLAQAMRRRAHVHVVTQTRNRDAFVRAGLVEGQDFTAIDSEAVAAPMYRLANLLRMGSGKGWTMVTAIASLSYPYFERLVWKKFGARIQAGEFDVVHRITPLSPTIASSLAPKVAAAKVPFVLGPLNGGVPWPKGFDSERRREREWLSYVRGAYKANPAHRKMLRSSALIIAGSRHTAGEIPAAHQHKTVWLPENAIDPARFNLTAPQDLTGPLRACFLGRLVPYKGPDMLLEAAAPLMREGKLVLDMIGDGPMADDLRAQAERLQISHAVTFHGHLPHDQVQPVLARANLMTFPSIREFGGGVVLEAMALGVVPMVVDYAGPGELVTGETGYLIPVGPRPRIVAAFRAALEALAADPSGLPVKAQAARRTALADFTWDAKAARILAFYAAIPDLQAA